MCMYVLFYIFLIAILHIYFLPKIAPLIFRLFLRKPQDINNNGMITAANHLHGEITEYSKEEIILLKFF